MRKSRRAPGTRPGAIKSDRLDENHRSLFSAKAQSMIADSNDAGLPRLNERDFGLISQPHFMQPSHQHRIALNLDDASVLTGVEHVERK